MSGLQGVSGILNGLIIIGSKDERHLRNLESALECMSGMAIKLKKEKCVFMKVKVEYLAFVVIRNGIHPSPRKVQAIREVQAPENFTGLKSFSGMVNYYRRFIPDMASKYHGYANAFSRLPRKTTEEAHDWSMERDQVNRLLM